MNKYPVEALASALHHAANCALPEVSHTVLDRESMAVWSPEARHAAAKANRLLYKSASRRPYPEECEIKAMFLQTWGSTAMGFGGVGGAAVTSVYTVVIQGPDRTAAVYWAGQLAYLVPPGVSDAQREMFRQDVSKGHTAARRNAAERYGALVADPD